MDDRTAVSTSHPSLDARLAFENRQEPERHVTKVIVQLAQLVAQDLQIEARGRFISHIDVWPTGEASAVISIEEQLNLPTSARVKVSAPLTGAYDVTVYTTEADDLSLNVELI
jgi:hypothetical protein